MTVLTHAFEFTNVYRKHLADHPAIREAMCLQVQFPYSLQPIEADDLFAGRYKRPAIRFTSHACDELAYSVDERELRQAAELSETSDDEKKQLEELIEFWNHETTVAKVRSAYPTYMMEAIPSDDWIWEPGIAFPLYRMCGANVNFDKWLQLGIPGMKEELAKYRQSAVDNGNDTAFFDAMQTALELLSDVCLFYASQAQRLSDNAPDLSRRQELREMAQVLAKISSYKPETLREAMQLFWLYALVSGVRNYGRMDVYFGDFYAADLASGILTETKALQLTQSLWRLITSLNTIFESRVIIGGVGRRNESAADRFAFLAMEATRTVHEIEPQLSLRCYTGMNPKLLDVALTVIGEGRTYPMLYNDDINVPAVEHAFSVGKEEAMQYLPFGCGECILDHRSMGTPSGVINLLKVLEDVLREGSYDKFDQLFEAYRRKTEKMVRIMAEQESIEYKVTGDNVAYLYTSMLYDDCLERGKPIFSGGIRYLGGTLESYGNMNTADSLLAIKQLVFEQNRFTLEQLVRMLDANFAGFESERRAMLEVPKFGNDDDEADAMAKAVHEHICKAIRDEGSRAGLHSYLNVIVNNQANTLLGRHTAASADGRKAGKSMANGNTPTGGSDRKGLTALLNSIVKLDPTVHAGAVHNLKCGKDMFTTHKEVFKSLLKTYFASGGTQLMITVVNRHDLERAMAEPEKYPHVFVRVGGFSARFIELSREVQEDILNRTLY